LANRPRIILADEPTAALDSKRAGIVMDLLRKVAVEQEAAIIAVTHLVQGRQMDNTRFPFLPAHRL
jgi:ABC-type lipoprotein export system ATPase subunit